MLICKNYDQQEDKSCKHYHATDKRKVGFCFLFMKNTFFCHYSEMFLNQYNGDAEIITKEQFDLFPKH